MTSLVTKLCLLALMLLSAACENPDRASIITSQELVSRINDNTAPAIIDVRTAAEYNRGYIPGAINIPISQIGDSISQLKFDKGDEIVVYCERGVRAKKAQAILQQHGFFEVRHLDGDMKQWRADKLLCEGC